MPALIVPLARILVVCVAVSVGSSFLWPERARPNFRAWLAAAKVCFILSLDPPAASRFQLETTVLAFQPHDRDRSPRTRRGGPHLSIRGLHGGSAPQLPLRTTPRPERTASTDAPDRGHIRRATLGLQCRIRSPAIGSVALTNVTHLSAGGLRGRRHLTRDARAAPCARCLGTGHPDRHCTTDDGNVSANL